MTFLPMLSNSSDYQDLKFFTNPIDEKSYRNIILYLKILKRFIYLFRKRERERERERERDRQREKQAPCREPDAGLNPGTLGS